MHAEDAVRLFAFQRVLDRPVVLHHQREIADPRCQPGVCRGRSEPVFCEQTLAGNDFGTYAQSGAGTALKINLGAGF